MEMDMVEKLSITLPTDMVHIIKTKVGTGHYASTSEVLREAMRAWIRQEEEHEIRMAAIQARIDRALNDPRPSLSSDEVHGRLDALYENHSRADNPS